TTDTYSIASSVCDDAGYYDCVVSGCGSVTSLAAELAFESGQCASDVEPGTETTPLATPTTGTCSPPDTVHTAALDPVNLFSGEFYENFVDLRIPGIGLDFVWGRKYRSKIGPSTELGHGWDWSYDVRLEQVSGNFVLHDGNSRSDTYTETSPG